MAITIKTKGLGVNTIYSSLSVTLAIEPLGDSSLHQWYYRNENRYSPSHSVIPVRLKPVATVHDPETKESYNPTIASVVWTVTTKTGSTDYVISDTTADYSVSSDGTLTVSKDIPYDDPVTLLCTVRYIGETGENGVVAESVQLVTDVTSDPSYIIKVYGAGNGKSFGNKLWWNPLSGVTSTMTMTALVMKGLEDASANVKYFWYYVNNGSEVLVDDADSPCMCYVSGQGTQTLTIDAQYENEAIEFHVRIAESSTATEPDVDNVHGLATLRWYVGNVTVEAYSDNGDTVRQGMNTHVFAARVKQNGMDVDLSIAQKYINIEWKRSYTDSSGNVTTTTEGAGTTVEIAESRLKNSTYPVAITPDASFVGAYKVVVAYDSYTRGSDGVPVGVGDAKVVLYDGKIVVSQ